MKGALKSAPRPLAVGAVKAVLLLSLMPTLSISIAAIRFDWTATEISCASTIGVDLLNPTNPNSTSYARHLTWVADLVVAGKVTKIQHDIRGPYPTIVELQVVQTLKGSASGTICVNLSSGPRFSTRSQHMIKVAEVDEPEFLKNQDVIVFLTTSYLVRTGDPGYYALAENHYRLLDHAKWNLAQGTASLAIAPYTSQSISSLKAEVQLARSTQQAGCP